MNFRSRPPTDVKIHGTYTGDWCQARFCLSIFLFAVYIDDIVELFCLERGARIVLYADDIILVTSSVSELQKVLEICQRELQNLDMSINVITH